MQLSTHRLCKGAGWASLMTVASILLIFLERHRHKAAPRCRCGGFCAAYYKDDKPDHGSGQGLSWSSTRVHHSWLSILWTSCHGRGSMVSIRCPSALARLSASWPRKARRVNCSIAAPQYLSAKKGGLELASCTEAPANMTVWEWAPCHWHSCALWPAR